MKILNKTAKTVTLGLTKQDLRIVRKDPKVAQAINDAMLPQFLDEVDRLYRSTFGMTELPESIRSQLASSIRSSLRNTRPLPDVGVDDGVRQLDEEELEDLEISGEGLSDFGERDFDGEAVPKSNDVRRIPEFDSSRWDDPAKRKPVI